LTRLGHVNDGSSSPDHNRIHLVLLTGEAHSFATLPGAQQQEKVVFENLNVKIPFSVDSFDLKQKNELITFSIMIRLD
jgi:hypothetical protein